MAITTLYGISNCDTVRAARRWLNSRGVDYRFHDFRKGGIDQDMLTAWAEALGWDNLLNRRGTTWRQLSAGEREGVDGRRACALMHAHPTLIKRPVLDVDGGLHVGFDDQVYEQLFP